MQAAAVILAPIVNLNVAAVEKLVARRSTARHGPHLLAECPKRLGIMIIGSSTKTNGSRIEETQRISFSSSLGYPVLPVRNTAIVGCWFRRSSPQTPKEKQWVKPLLVTAEGDETHNLKMSEKLTSLQHQMKAPNCLHLVSSAHPLFYCINLLFLSFIYYDSHVSICVFCFLA